MGYFTVRITPDIVDGDISKIIASNKSDAPFADNDILFDWQPLQIPKGTNRLISVSGYMMGEDGGTQSNADLSFIFAKSVDGTAQHHPFQLFFAKSKLNALTNIICFWLGFKS